jgi:hypothetical protein
LRPKKRLSTSPLTPPSKQRTPRQNRGSTTSYAAAFGIWSMIFETSPLTAHCQAERERRMALEALVGGKNFHLYFDSMLRSLSLTTVPLPQMFPTGTVT